MVAGGVVNHLLQVGEGLMKSEVQKYEQGVCVCVCVVCEWRCDGVGWRWKVIYVLWIIM